MRTRPRRRQALHDGPTFGIARQERRLSRRGGHDGTTPLRNGFGVVVARRAALAATAAAAVPLGSLNNTLHDGPTFGIARQERRLSRRGGHDGRRSRGGGGKRRMTSPRGQQRARGPSFPPVLLARQSPSACSDPSRRRRWCVLGRRILGSLLERFAFTLLLLQALLLGETLRSRSLLPAAPPSASNDKPARPAKSARPVVPSRPSRTAVAPSESRGRNAGCRVAAGTMGVVAEAEGGSAGAGRSSKTPPFLQHRLQLRMTSPRGQQRARGPSFPPVLACSSALRSRFFSFKRSFLARRFAAARS
jgi:hypothetical protein